ncbi:MAG: DinB family protein [Thermoanaerobaculia bacterium]
MSDSARTGTFHLEEAIAILERTPRILRAWLSDLPAAWIEADEGEETWNAFDIVGHLIHGERTDWIARARIVLEHGEGRAFDPFDRFAQFRESRGRTLGELLDEFAERRRRNIETLRALELKPRELGLAGLHPELGRVTLSELLATWVAHDLGHIAQIARVMAKRYRSAVGAWQAYLPVLRDREESS